MRRNFNPLLPFVLLALAFLFAACVYDPTIAGRIIEMMLTRPIVR